MGGRTVCTLYLDVLLTECARDSVVDSVVAPSETRSSEMHRDRRVRGDSGTGSRFRGRAERETGTGRPRRARSARLVLTAKRVIRRRGHESVV